MYRIAKIDLEIKPVFDTYIPGAAPVAGPTSVPYLYWQIVRDGDYPTAPTNLYFEQRGSKPIRLDDKIIKVGWKPNALTDVQGGLGSPTNGNIKMTPWLSADASGGAGWLPNATPHYGVVFAAFCSGVGAYKVMTAVMKVHYQFKQAHTQGPSPTVVFPFTMRRLLVIPSFLMLLATHSIIHWVVHRTMRKFARILIDFQDATFNDKIAEE